MVEVRMQGLAVDVVEWRGSVDCGGWSSRGFT